MKRITTLQQLLFLGVVAGCALLGQYENPSVNTLLAETAPPSATTQPTVEPPATNPLKPTSAPVRVAVPKPKPLPAQPVPRETAVVTRVIDGDTVEITKGKHECFGQEAASKNSQLVLNKRVTLKKDVSDRDRYGRLLRYVWVGTTFVNAELLKLGYAAILTIPPDVAQASSFKQLQAKARTEQRGLWSSCGSVHKQT